MSEKSPHAAARPAPDASGTLAKTPFLHLVLYALERKLTGSIELLSPSSSSGERALAVVRFVGGLPAKVRTSEGVAHLGRVLLELGHLTEGQLDRSLADLALARESGRGPRLHGELLLAQGVIDSAKLQAGFEEQTARKLRYVAGLPAETTYAYYGAFDALRGWGGEDTRGVDPMPLLWGILCAAPPWEHVGAALARVAASPLRLARAADPGRLGFGPEVLAVVELLRGCPLRVSELAHAGALNERTAQLVVYLLLATKQVDVLPVSRVAGSSIAPPQSARAAPRAPKSSLPPAAAPLPGPPLSLRPELSDRWREIVGRASTIDRTDYFMMLDLARDADKDAIEEAFFKLAKRWHPDRLPPELAPVREACSRVFARISEARATLADDEQRMRYMRLLADGSGSPAMQEAVARVIEAAGHFQKAEVFFKRNDLAQAESFCRKALDLDASQGDYHALLAWLVSLKPESQSAEKTLECVKMLDKAVQLNGRCEKAFFWRGMLYKRLGKHEHALRDFRRVADMNPHNIDAVREVRLFQMRGITRSAPPPARRSLTPPAKPDDATKGGIFGRLFKK